MPGLKNNRNKLIIGVIISIVCLFLAFRQVNFSEMWQAFKKANYWYMAPAVSVLFLSHFLRAIRWRYLLDPIRRLDTRSLFSSLIIGYAANTFTPAHLGEFLRAYVLSKKRQIPMSPVFATIVVERIIDVFSLLCLMLLAFFLNPFPDWVINSGYVMFVGSAGLLAFLIFLKKKESTTMKFAGVIFKAFPQGFENRIELIIKKFVTGISPLRRWHDYITTAILSFIIWACYGGSIYFCLHAFDFVGAYHLDWTVSLIILVITTIAVVVPSSPGYIGTYHYLCQISLAMFAVPAGPALSYATVLHGVNFLPVFIVGFIFANYEGMAILRMSDRVSEIEKAEHAGKV